MKSRSNLSNFSLVSLLSCALFIGAINLTGCSAHSLSGAELDEVSETTQITPDEVLYGQDPAHNEDPADVETRKGGKGGSGGSIDYMAEHNETNE